MTVDSDKSKEDLLRDNLSFMYGRINAFSEIQAYIEREISETSEEIGRIKSLLKEDETISLKELAHKVLERNKQRGFRDEPFWE